MGRLRWLMAACTVRLLSACAGNGEGLDANGRPAAESGEPLTAQLQSIQDHVFTPICTACHTGAAAPLGLRLDADSSFAMLVGTPSVEVPGLMRVAPGNPDSSYLIQKLEGHAAVGGQMPLGQPALPQATIDVIRQWITDGAQPAVASAQGTSVLHIRAVAPLPGDALAHGPAQILVAADGELDMASINSGSVMLTRSGGDGGFDEGNEVDVADVSIAMHSLDPTVLAVSIPAPDWVPDRYRLTLSGQAPAPVVGRDGAPIDGAGLGISGSDFVLEFTVGQTR